MDIKKLIGLVLIITGVAILPFGYWIHIKWVVYGALFLIPGLILYLYGRKEKELRSIEKNDNGIYPGSELGGFNGSDIFDDD
jgi:hypothetical protein